MHVVLLAGSPSPQSRPTRRLKYIGEQLEACLQYLYIDEGREIIANHCYHPTVEKIAKKYASQFPSVKRFTINDVFGGWTPAQKVRFADGGEFDQIYQLGKQLSFTM